MSFESRWRFDELDRRLEQRCSSRSLREGCPEPRFASLLVSGEELSEASALCRRCLVAALERQPAGSLAVVVKA